MFLMVLWWCVTKQKKLAQLNRIIMFKKGSQDIKALATFFILKVDGRTRGGTCARDIKINALLMAKISREQDAIKAQLVYTIFDN